MKKEKILIITPIGIILILVTAFLSDSGDHKLFLETYKILLSFMLIGIIGAFVKMIFDLTMAKQKDEDRHYEEWEKERVGILYEFTHIFSEFYSLRKLYHSARSDNNTIYKVDTQDYFILIRECLKKAVDLEGRFGALKITIIRHFGLPMGDYGTKKISKLKETKQSEKDKNKKLRHSLDILGESFDDWRHALEQNRKINLSNEIWKIYEEILCFLDSRKYHAVEENKD